MHELIMTIELYGIHNCSPLSVRSSLKCVPCSQRSIRKKPPSFRKSATATHEVTHRGSSMGSWEPRLSSKKLAPISPMWSEFQCKCMPLNKSTPCARLATLLVPKREMQIFYSSQRRRLRHVSFKMMYVQFTSSMSGIQGV